MMNKENMTPIQMLQTVSGICKTNGKLDWTDSGLKPEAEFRFIADMIDNFLQYDHNESEVKND